VFGGEIKAQPVGQPFPCQVVVLGGIHQHPVQIKQRGPDHPRHLISSRVLRRASMVRLAKASALERSAASGWSRLQIRNLPSQ